MSICIVRGEERLGLGEGWFEVVESEALHWELRVCICNIRSSEFVYG